MSDIPEVWAKAMIEAGFIDRRFTQVPTPSLRALADAAGLHPTTVSRMVSGRGVAKVENIAAVAEKLGVDVVKVSGWVRQTREETEPYDIPPEVDLLTRRERDALTELIRAVTESRRTGDGNAAASKHAEGSSALDLSVAPGDTLEREASQPRGRVRRRSDQDE